MDVQIVYPSKELISSFYQCLGLVAAERIYIEMLTPPPLQDVMEFQMGLVSRNGAVYYAVINGRVVGWCDVFPEENPRQSHRGSLGMGLLPEFRGKGIGYALMTAVLNHAKKQGLEKVELNVYTSNSAAIALYRKAGFTEEGLVKKYRKLDGIYYDCLTMAKFL